jgi:hypothetical protein
MKLITELVEEIDFTKELTEGFKEPQWYIEGIFLQCDKKNRNGRIYPLKNVSPEVNRFIKESINTKRAIGELGHPAGPQINLDRVSHLITELHRDGSDYYGKAMLINTPMGNIAKGLLSSGVKLGVSSRGMGSIIPDKNGIVVQGDFKLATVDIVADPSAPDAWVDGIMENVDWVYDSVNDEWLTETKNSIKKMNHSEIESNKLKMFEEFISRLSSKTLI